MSREFFIRSIATNMSLSNPLMLTYSKKWFPCFLFCSFWVELGVGLLSCFIFLLGSEWDGELTSMLVRIRIMKLGNIKVKYVYLIENPIKYFNGQLLLFSNFTSINLSKSQRHTNVDVYVGSFLYSHFMQSQTWLLKFYEG